MTPAYVRRFCKDILRQYPLMKQELAVLEGERKAIGGAIPFAWPVEVRIKAPSNRTANQAFRLLWLEERWRQVRFYVQDVEDLLLCLDGKQVKEGISFILEKCYNKEYSKTSRKWRDNYA